MPLCVYALVEMDRRAALRAPRGAGGERTRLVPVGRIGAVVGEVASAPEPGERAVRAHDAVVRAAARSWRAVLPVRFGTIAGDARALRRAIRDRRPAVARALAQVRGRVQMTIRVFGTPAPIVGAADPVVDRRAGPGTRYLRRAAAIDARSRRVPQLDPIRAAVADLVREERVEPHASAPLVASVFHLVDRDRARAYVRRVRAASASAPLRLAVTGPFPPYAFGPEDL